MTPRQRLPFLTLVLAFAACTDRFVAPGACPAFCPSGTIATSDTILTDVVVRDSAFRGYLQGYESEALPVAELPGISSRAIFLMNQMFTRVVQKEGDTTTVPITVDSSWLRMDIARRDTNTSNLWIKLYRLPLTIDSTTTFGALTADFSAAPLDSVNLDSLLARPDVFDSATLANWKDTIRTDGAGHVLQFAPDSSIFLYFVLDTLKAPFVVADSGQLAFGVRVAADSLASIALGSNDVIDRDPILNRFYHYTGKDAQGNDSTVAKTAQRETIFDSFVFDPPTPPLDSNLAVGGVPSARSLLRVALPSFLRDTSDVVRATLILVPTAPVSGAVGDSFRVVVRPVISDLGAKSPLGTDDREWGLITVHMGSVDTLRIEVTNMVRRWAFDTSAVTALVLGQIPEAASYSEIRFFSSRTPAFRPGLRVTYVRRFPFGVP